MFPLLTPQLNAALKIAQTTPTTIEILLNPSDMLFFQLTN